jgi:hypothetical protein
MKEEKRWLVWLEAAAHTDTRHSSGSRMVWHWYASRGNVQIMHLVAPSKNLVIANHASYTLCKLYNILGKLMAQEQIFKTEIYKMHRHPPKCKFVGWLAIQNRTADRLRTRGWPNNVVCPLYRRERESVHPLAHCKYWNASSISENWQ